MNRLRVALVGVLVAVCAVLVPVASAQEVEPFEITGVDLSAFPTVRLRVAASAEATAALDDGRLEVTENGTAVDAEVTTLSDEVVAVLLAIDTSGSMENAIGAAKDAAAGLIASLPDSARVAVVGFSNTATLVSAFTTDRDVSLEAVDGVQAAGGTAMYDALVVAAEQVRASDADRTAIVLLSDGADTESTRADLEGAKAALAGAADDFYAVGLRTEETDDAALAALAEAGGGRVVAAADPAALEAVYADLGQRIANQFQLEFTSTTPDPTGTFAVSVAGTELAGSVEVALPDRPAPTPTIPGTGRSLPEPLIGTANPNVLAKSWVVYLGAVLIAGAVVTLGAIAIASGSGMPRRSRRSLRADNIDHDESRLEGAFESVRASATDLASRVVERADVARPIDAALDRAGLIMRAGEFVTMVLAIALGAGVLLYLLLGPVFGAIGLLVPIFGARAALEFMASRRNNKFSDQLGDTLLIMAGSLRSGFGVGQSIDTVAQEMDPPMSTEFQRALLETRLGRDIEDALLGIAKRVQNEDFAWVVDAIRINHEVGGELATILDQVADTIRARNRLKRQVSALTAEGRMSAYVLGVLPVGIGVILFASNPDYLRPLWEEGAGQIMLGFAVGLLLAGIAWLRKMIDIEY